MFKPLLRAAALAGPTVLFLLGGLIGRSQAYPGDVFATGGAAKTAPVSPTAAIDGNSWSVASRTGAAQYSFPIAVPPGRGLAPQIGISYTSQGARRGSPVGAGWSLVGIPAIRLDTSRSRLEEPRFVSDLAGGSPLIEVNEPGASPGVRTFRAQNDASFTRYELIDSEGHLQWTARTTDGMVYTFGTVPSARDNAAALDAADAIGARWFVTKVEDPYGNATRFYYKKVVGRALSGRYNVPVDIAIESIYYNDNWEQGTTPHARVRFEYYDDRLETCPDSDIPVGARFDFRSGIRIYEGALRLTKVITEVRDEPGAPWRPVREVELGHDLAALGYLGGTLDPAGQTCRRFHSPARMLASITERARGKSGAWTEMPPITFDYSRLHLDPSEPMSVPALAGGRVGGGRQPNTLANKADMPTADVMLVDLDGDGVLDRLVTDENRGGQMCNVLWQKNVGDGQFDAAALTGFQAMPWASHPMATQHEGCNLAFQLSRRTHLDDTDAPQRAYNYGYYRLLDVDGDGLDDLVTSWEYRREHYDPKLDTEPDRAYGQARFGGELSSTLPLGSCIRTDDCDPGWTNCALRVCASRWDLLGADAEALGLLFQRYRGVTVYCRAGTEGTDDNPSCPTQECLDAVDDIIESVGGLVEEAACDCLPEACSGDPNRNKWTVPIEGADYGLENTGSMSSGIGGIHTDNLITPETHGGRYVWRVYWNQGDGQFSPTPTVTYAPVHLEALRPVGRLGADDLASASSWHGTADLDGDGCLDIVWQQPSPLDRDWYGDLQVWRGDCRGGFHGDPDGDPAGAPYLWSAPILADPDDPSPADRARVSLRGVAGTGTTVTNHRGHRVIETLSTLADINGDGLPDLTISKRLTASEGEQYGQGGSQAPLRVFYNTGTGFEEIAPEDATVLSDDVHVLERSEEVILLEPRAFPDRVSWSMQTLRYGDLDADGLGDVAVLARPGCGHVDPWSAPRACLPGTAGTPGAPLEGLAVDPQFNVGDRLVPGTASPGLLAARMALGRVQLMDSTLWGAATDFVDLDGDGIPEAFNNEPSNHWSCTPDDLRLTAGFTWAGCASDEPHQVLTDPEARGGLGVLATVDNGRGGIVTFEYAPAFDVVELGDEPASGRAFVPPALRVVTKVTAHSTVGGADVPDAVTQYAYHGPVFNEDDTGDDVRPGSFGFRGFRRVVITHPAALTRDDGGDALVSPATEERYDFETHWSGYLTETVSYADEPGGGVYGISRTSYATLSLFDGAIVTMHPTESASWNCDGAQSEQQCLASGVLVRTVTGWRPVNAYAETGGTGGATGGTRVVATIANADSGELATSPSAVDSTITVRAGEREVASTSDASGTATATASTSANVYVCGASFTMPPSGTTAVPVMYAPCGERVTESPDAVRAGDRRATHAYQLRYSETDYQLLETDTQRSIATADGGPTNWAGLATSGRSHAVYDNKGFAIEQHVWHDADTVAITKRTRYPNGNLSTVQRPNQVEAGSGRMTRIYYGAFGVFPRITQNELYHTSLAETDLATGQVTFASTLQNGAAPGTVVAYDGFGRPIETYFADNYFGTALAKRVSVIEYDDAVDDGDPTGTTASVFETYAGDNPVVTTVTYDGFGRQLTSAVETSLGPAVASTRYDAAGQVIATVGPDPRNDAATVTFQYRHDTAGRLTHWIPPQNVTSPEIRAATSRLQYGIAIEPSGARRLVTRRFQELPVGAMPGEEPSDVLLTSDAYGRLVRVQEDPADPIAVTAYGWDANDNMTWIRDADNVTTQMIHDWVGQRREIRRAGRVWSYQYDLDGNLTVETPPIPESVAAADHPKWSNIFGYDAIGREIARKPGLRDLDNANARRYGLLRALSGAGTDPQTIYFDYDLAPSSTSGGPPMYENAVGRLARVRLPWATIDYSYSREGWPVAERRAFNVRPFANTFADTRTVNIAYNARGQATSVEHADGTSTDAPTTTVVGYDERGLPESLSIALPGGYEELAHIQRSLGGLVRERTSYVMRHRFEYDAVGRVRFHRVMGGYATPFTKTGEWLSWESVGNVRKVQNMGNYVVLDYHYDVRHQLVSATSSDPLSYNGIWDYTPAGKLSYAFVSSSTTTTDVVPREVTYEYEPIVEPYPNPENPTSYVDAFDDRVLALRTASGGALASYAYDQVGGVPGNGPGNVTSRNINGEHWDFIYDGEDHLREAVKGALPPHDPSLPHDGEIGAEVYFYDHTGTRMLAVRSEQLGVESARYWQGETEIRYTATGTERIVHATLGAQPIAQITDGAWTNVDLTWNGVLGSLLAVTDTAGNIKARYAYGPWGEITWKQGPELDEYDRLYNGKTLDGLTRLGYYGFRYYDRLSLKWTQADMLYRVAPDLAYDRPRRMGLYTFNLNNPVRYVDPDGLQEVAMPLLLGAGEGVGLGVGAASLGAGIVVLGLGYVTIETGHADAMGERDGQSSYLARMDAMERMRDARTHWDRDVRRRIKRQKKRVAERLKDSSAMNEKKKDKPAKPVKTPTPEDELTEKLGRKPTKKELQNYKNNKKLDSEGDAEGSKADSAGEPPRGGHRKSRRRSTKQKHEEGDARRKRDQGGEKGDVRRPY